MLKKTSSYEVWLYVKDGKALGVVARVPELLRLNLISVEPDFKLEDLNKWLYISKDGSSTEEYNTFEEAEADLV